MRRAGAVGAALAAVLWCAAPAGAVQKNLEPVKTLPEAKYATAINFLQYGHGRHARDVMIATGRFGLISYDLRDPARPRRLDSLENEALRLQGDPPVDFGDADGSGSPDSTYWQNEDMDVDQRRKLVFMARDPRSFKGKTASDTSVAGVYIVDARDPADLRLLNFTQLPTGHTTTCINGCDYLWTGGPASSDGQKAIGWTGGRPIIVTDVRDPRNPRVIQQPIDLLRDDGETAYSHDVQVDRQGIAWVSGQGGTRGYWTRGRHYDPLKGHERRATAADPVPYAGGAFEDGATPSGFMHNSARRGSLIMATEEADAPPDCADKAKFTVASLAGSYDGEGWRSTPEHPFRMQTVGQWSPHGQEGTADGVYCSAHYFQVRGRYVAYSWYDQGTRILDISDPANPVQVAYYRPDGGVSWAPYFHDGLIYVADHARGVEVLRVTRGAHRGREVVAPRISDRHRRLVVASSKGLRPDPQLGWMCPLPVY
jgi:hypothetical protein